MILRAWRSAWRDVWEGLRSQPGRAGLAALAVAVGVLALTVLLALLGGLNDKARRLVRELGANVVAVFPASGSGPTTMFSDRHVTLLSANLPDCSVSRIRRYTVGMDGSETAFSVIATDPAFAELRNWRITEGRFLDEWDMLHGQRHAVLTRAASERLRLKIGDVLPLQGAPFRIVGVAEAETPALSEAPSTMPASSDRTIYVPHTVDAPWRTMAAADGAYDGIFLRPAEEGARENIPPRVDQLLGDPALPTVPREWVTPDVLVAGVRRLQRTIKMSLGSVAALCLLLGGTTLMSLMVANVRDRIPEIGLRRALGARPAEVAALFVLESALITLASAVAGGMLALALLTLAGPYFPAPLRLAADTFLLPVLASLGLGVMFSVMPSRMAAMISPAEALRSE